MEKKSFFTIMIIPHWGEEPRSIKIPRIVLNFLSVFFITTLTIGSLWTYNYVLIKTENNSLATINTDNKVIIEEYTESFLTLYQDVKVLKEQAIEVQELEEEVRGLNDFDPTKSRFSTSNQNALAHAQEKNGFTASSIEETKDAIDSLKEVIPDQELSLNKLLNLMQERNEVLLSTPSISPTNGYVSSKYGYRIDPVYRGSEFHTGLDVANSYNSSIYATADGVVTVAGYQSNGYGYQVVVNHGNGYETFYGHSSRLNVQVGDYVKKGETIAYIGSTGKSTGPHVHYEVRLYGKTTNPENYIN